jgi:hypothetical protein
MDGEEMPPYVGPRRRVHTEGLEAEERVAAQPRGADAARLERVENTGAQRRPEAAGSAAPAQSVSIR